MARYITAYIAASWTQRFRLRGTRSYLHTLGIRVNSQWLNFDHGYDEGDFIREAARDYGDIDRADFVILDTTDTDTRGGRDWETGYAVGRGKRVIRVGPVITPFHAAIPLGFPSWDDCFAHFATAVEHSGIRNN